MLFRSAIQRARRAVAGEKVLFNGQERDPRYWFKRETLHGLMKPLIDAELAPTLRAIVSDEIRREHKRETEAKRDRVAEGRHKSNVRGPRVAPSSAVQQKPWEALGISRATYYRKKAAGTL